MRPGQSIEVDGEKWLVLRVAGARAEIKRMGEGEKPTPLHLKEGRRLWMEAWRKAKKARVGK